MYKFKKLDIIFLYMSEPPTPNYGEWTHEPGVQIKPQDRVVIIEDKLHPLRQAYDKVYWYLGSVGKEVRITGDGDSQIYASSVEAFDDVENIEVNDKFRRNTRHTVCYDGIRIEVPLLVPDRTNSTGVASYYANILVGSFASLTHGEMLRLREIYEEDIPEESRHVKKINFLENINRKDRRSFETGSFGFRISSVNFENGVYFPDPAENLDRITQALRTVNTTQYSDEIIQDFTKRMSNFFDPVVIVGLLEKIQQSKRA